MDLVRKTLLTAGILVLLAPAAFAQTSGTITITGTTPEAFSLTNTSEGTLSSTVTLGTLTPGTGQTTAALVTGSADVRLRSNKLYKVTATAGALSITSPGSTDGGSTIAASDIGFGITSITATGANVAASHSDTITAGYDVSGGWPAPTNGLTPTFGKTLADITAGTQVLNGTRISAKGNLTTDNNFITVRFSAATMPQFFTPNGGFSSVITLTIASN
jgi:hypothetical protein